MGCAVAALWHVLLSKKSPQARLLWLLTVAVLPVLGPIAYAAVGVDRLGRRATVKELRNRAIRSDIEALLSASRSEAAIPAENRVLPEYLWGFARLLANLSRYRALPGNSVDVLRSGDVFFGRLVAAIDSARSSVLVESYIFDCDVIGHRLLDALGRAAQRGVRCCLLYDAVGSLHMDLIAVARAERLGVRVSPFAARSWLRGRSPPQSRGAAPRTGCGSRTTPELGRSLAEY